MPNSVEEFKGFVRKHPKLKQEVRDGKRTWQAIYEEWVLLGEDDQDWDDFVEVKEEETTTSSSSSSSSIDGQEMLKTALNYVKKVKPDDITKALSSIQKVVGLFQAFNGGSNKQTNQQPMQQNYRPRRYVDPLFRRFDDYDD